MRSSGCRVEAGFTPSSPDVDAGDLGWRIEQFEVGGRHVGKRWVRANALVDIRGLVVQHRLTVGPQVDAAVGVGLLIR